MKKHTVFTSFAVMLLIIAIESCRKPKLLEESDYNEWLSGGSQTVFDEGSGAFSHPFPNLSGNKEAVHGIGDAAFEVQFVGAPSQIRPGLGSIFNSNSCFSCHIADGRGKPPVGAEPMVSMLFRMSQPGTDPHGGPNPAIGFGGQLQQHAIFGVQPEAGINISYNDVTYLFADNTSYHLQFPTYTLVNPYITLPSGVMISPRVAPPVFGLGLLEAIPDYTILSGADENDVNGDGISGKANYVWNIQKQVLTLGRFGWKCEAPSLLQQSAGAYNQDMGVTNFLFPEESSYGQSQYDNLSDEVEVSDSLLHAVTFYMRTLAVPARRNADDLEVLKGKKIFRQAKCSSCHTPMMKTEVNVAFAELSNQTIFPYSDLLLHDMGTDLADNRPTFLANGQEWRTPPLWGIGLTQVVNGHQNFLHDGRARNLMEAIMWHGGESLYSKKYVENLSLTDRNALIKFLQSL
jgi:CxxC motif-containing protein (DUF1111 family)